MPPSQTPPASFSPAGPAQRDPLHPGMDKTVLIVDDTPENLLVLNEVLEPHYRVRAATSGERALQVAASIPFPDIVLLDIMMPDMDGYAVLERLRANPATRDTPVIFVTAMGAIGDEERGLNLGAVDYITKPIQPAIVLARVRTQLELKQARDWLRDRGYRVLIDGLNPMSLQYYNPGLLNADYYKVAWTNSFMDVESAQEHAETGALVDRIGAERFILGRTDSEAAVRWALTLGVRRFQGFFIDLLVKKQAEKRGIPMASASRRR